MARRQRRPPPGPRFSAFALRLALYLFLASLPFSVLGAHRRLGWLQSALAAAVGATANTVGGRVTVSGHLVYAGSAALDINHECTGIFVLLVYAAFVFAYPARWRHRLAGFVAGAVTLTAFNFARLVALTLVASRQPRWFGYLHEYFFQGVFLAVLGLLAAAWTEWVRREAVARLSR